MKILLLLGDFGLPTLFALRNSRHHLVGTVVAKPASPPPPPSAGEWLKARVRPLIWPGAGWIAPSDLRPWRAKAILKQFGVPVLSWERPDPTALNEAIRRTEAELLLSVGFPLHLPPAVLKQTRFGGLNVHPSLLPKYRGPSPVFWQIASGETRSGLSLHRMTEEIDAGPILWQEGVDVRPDETTAELFLRLARMAGARIPSVLDRLEFDALPERVQDAGAASRQQRARPEDAAIDWTRPAVELACLVRACSPSPGAWTTLPLGRRLRIWRAAPVPRPCAAPPGVIVIRRRWTFDVATGSGTLSVRTATSDDGHRFPTFGRPWPELAIGVQVGARSGK